MAAFTQVLIVRDVEVVYIALEIALQASIASMPNDLAKPYFM